VDNIQKGIMIVLGAAALLVLIMQNDDSGVVKQTKTAQPIANERPAVAPPATADDTDPNGEYASQDENSEASDEYATFGDPMMDASPAEANSGSQSEYASPGVAPSQERSGPARDVPPTQPASATLGPPGT
jgi:hypothetical protein